MSDTITPGRILITGGAGFIGSHLADLLVRLGHHVTIVDNLSTGRRKNMAHLEGDRVRFIETCVAEALPQLASETFDQIYHLAAAVGVQLVLDHPIETIETNIFDTAKVLTAAERWGAPVLIASSSEVYGKITRIPVGEEDDLIYGPTSITRWSYGYSKAIDEFLALAHFHEHGLGTVVARFFNTVGPRQVGTYGMVLPRFVDAAINGRPLTVFGDGTQSRCFCDVRDIVTAIVALLNKTVCHGQVYNVGSDRLITITDLAQLVIRVTGSNSSIEYLPYDQAYAGGFEDVMTRQPDLTRIQEAIGFAPRLTLEETIRDLEAYLRNETPIGEVKR